MSKEFLGDACAYLAPEKAGEKAKYPRIGAAFRDGERISVKIDSLPLASSGWQGWINIFPRELSSNNPREKSKGVASLDFDDDIPF
jgi:hypothetical protein